MEQNNIMHNAFWFAAIVGVLVFWYCSWGTKKRAPGTDIGSFAATLSGAKSEAI